MNDTNVIWGIVALATIAVVVLVALALAKRSRSKREALRGRFGPEYERAKERYGEGVAEGILADRARRVERMPIHALSEADRARFSAAWTVVQGLFVDDPRGAVARASALIKEVMRARGYRAGDAFERRAEDLSVDHPEVVQHYRAAHELARAGGVGQLATEDLRQAFVHYRVIFSDLLAPSQTYPTRMMPAHA